MLSYTHLTFSTLTEPLSHMHLVIPQLTDANFDKELAGKSAFIKFLAPW